MLKKFCVASALLLAATCLAQSGTPEAKDSAVRINQIQVVGSHNSYHSGLTPGVVMVLNKRNPKAVRALDYSHPALAQQFDHGVRQIEIDVHADSKGGRYAKLAADQWISDAGLPADPPYNADHAMDKPGFKVMHVVGIDQRTTCATFVECLTQVRTWTKAHPRAVPIFILVEAKDEQIKQLNIPPVESFTPAVFDALDTEIRSVFQPGEMITPDDLRGSSSTLPEAIQSHGWPALENSRGKVIFLLDNRKFAAMYAEGHPALKGRVIFTNSAPGTPESAFIEMNNGSAAEIDGLVKNGLLVRTRTDEGTEQARTNDTTRRELALHSGAQLISTDYPRGERSPWTNFVVELPGGLAARCNPVNAPKGCSDQSIEP